MTTTTDTTYNGRANRETWNVSLWIQNDESMYRTAVDWVEHQREWDELPEYDTFRHTLVELFGESTPDGVDWNDSRLDTDELDEMLMEL